MSSVDKNSVKPMPKRSIPPVYTDGSFSVMQEFAADLRALVTLLAGYPDCESSNVFDWYPGCEINTGDKSTVCDSPDRRINGQGGLVTYTAHNSVDSKLKSGMRLLGIFGRQSSPRCTTSKLCLGLDTWERLIGRPRPSANLGRRAVSF